MQQQQSCCCVRLTNQEDGSTRYRTDIGDQTSYATEKEAREFCAANGITWKWPARQSRYAAIEQRKVQNITSQARAGKARYARHLGAKIATAGEPDQEEQ